MASALAFAHIEGQRRIRLATVASVERLWAALPSYDEGNLEEWLRAVVPLVEGAQRTSIGLTRAFLAKRLERPPPEVDVDALIAGLRGGISTQEVYRRPFITVWSELGEGKRWEDATARGLQRAAAAAAIDVQMAMRAAANRIGEIYGR